MQQRSTDLPSHTDPIDQRCLSQPVHLVHAAVFACRPCRHFACNQSQPWAEWQYASSAQHLAPNSRLTHTFHFRAHLAGPHSPGGRAVSRQVAALKALHLCEVLDAAAIKGVLGEGVAAAVAGVAADPEAGPAELRAAAMAAVAAAAGGAGGGAGCGFSCVNDDGRSSSGQQQQLEVLEAGIPGRLLPAPGMEVKVSHRKKLTVTQNHLKHLECTHAVDGVNPSSAFCSALSAYWTPIAATFCQLFGSLAPAHLVAAPAYVTLAWKGFYNGPSHEAMKGSELHGFCFCGKSTKLMVTAKGEGRELA